jgi:alpha-tubulin suppressor-like RCC1 family protein
LIAIAACATLPREAQPARPARAPITSGSGGTAAALAPHAFPAAPAVPVRPPSAAPVVQITAAAEHACARHADGAVACWGANTLGQLGDPPVAVRGRPDKRDVRAVPGAAPVGDALAIATGPERTCIARADGVWCWGSPPGDAYRIAGTEEVQDLTASCARDAAGAVQCWHDLLAADPEPHTAGAVDVATDGMYVCVALSSGRVRCEPRQRLAYEGVEVVKVKGAVDVAMSGHHRCARTAAGAVWCWDGTEHYARNRRKKGPTKIAITAVAQVVVGSRFACARKDDRSVWCWGFSPGRDKDTWVDPAKPERVDDLEADELAAGYEFACARDGGEVFCFGDNERGQLGNGWSHVRTTPTVVPGITGAVDVHVAAQRSCARRRDGTVACWGRTIPKDHADPVDVASLAGATALGGAAGACGLLVDAKVGCEMPRDDTPSGVDGVIVDFAAADTHTVAAFSDGTVVSWGANTLGQFAGREASGATHAAMDGVDDAIAVAAAKDMTCVLHRDGTVGCAGRMLDTSRVGSPFASDHLVSVAGLSSATAIGIAEDHGCALIEGGTVACWGRGEYGQLGPAAAGVYASSAVAITGLDHVVQIAVTLGATCARRDDGTVVCWGVNGDGALGDPAALEWTADPVTIAITGATDLSLAEHACAVLATGEVACWGRSDNGQVGTLRSGWIPAPTRVTF